jgi:hypothetical protein
MPTERAIWYPFWYELDQPIAVGETGDFDFFKMPPEYVRTDGLPVFYHGDWQEKCRNLFVTERKQIIGINHSVLGQIDEIATDGLDYKFTMSDGRVLLVEAEETPGLIYEWPKPINDWRVLVEMEPA